MEQQKALSSLAVRLRVLKTAKKKELLDSFDEYTKKHCVGDGKRQRFKPFLLQSFVFYTYYLLEGSPYTQPQFSLHMTQKDIQNREKFNAIHSGIVAYVKSSDKERAEFKKSVLRIPSFLQKIDYLIKYFQNGQNIRE